MVILTSLNILLLHQNKATLIREAFLMMHGWVSMITNLNLTKQFKEQKLIWLTLVEEAPRMLRAIMEQIIKPKIYLVMNRVCKA